MEIRSELASCFDLSAHVWTISCTQHADIHKWQIYVRWAMLRLEWSLLHTWLQLYLCNWPYWPWSFNYDFKRESLFEILNFFYENDSACQRQSDFLLRSKVVQNKTWEISKKCFMLFFIQFVFLSDLNDFRIDKNALNIHK